MICVKEVLGLSIYIDVFFCVNLLMDCFLVITFMWIVGKTGSLARIIAASFVGALNACFSVVLCDRFFTNIYCNVLSVIFIIMILYYKKIHLPFVKIVRLCVIWYFNAFAMGGVFNYLINKKVTIMILARVVCAALLSMYILAGRNSLAKMRNSNANIYKVTLIKGGSRIYGYGYYDSGCKIYEPVSGNMAVVASFETLYEVLDEGECNYINIFPRLPDEWDGKTHIRSIPFSTIDKDKGIMPAVRIDEIILENESKNQSFGPCYVAVCKRKISKYNSFEFLLHCNMNLGG